MVTNDQVIARKAELLKQIAALFDDASIDDGEILFTDSETDVDFAITVQSL